MGGELRAVKGAQQLAWKAYMEAMQHEPLKSRMQSLVGIDSIYRKDVLSPLENDAKVADRALSDALIRYGALLKEAEKNGAENYHLAREARKLESEARAQRVTQRRYEQRLRYLEKSPALRSAARPLKEHLIQSQSKDGQFIECYYCQKLIAAGESHLEHKRPISRGGDNRRGNLALSCAPCNLRKGRKTQEEFLRDLGKGKT